MNKFKKYIITKKEKLLYYCKMGISSTHLRGEVSPFCNSLVMHGDTSNSSQDDVLGNLHSKTSHARDKDIGALHALHSLMAQHITAEGKEAPSAQLCTV